MRAIIPAAGLGTRMASVTGGRPKELLPLAGRPVLGWVLLEALEAGVSESIVVGSRAKPEIDAFVTNWSSGAVRVAYQDQMRGLAHAVYSAGVFQHDVLVLLGDTVYAPRSPLVRLAEALRRGRSAVAVELVDDDRVGRFGIVEPQPETCLVSRILEKPQPHETDSRLAVAGRFALTPDVLNMLRTRFERSGGPEVDREITLTDVLTDALAAGLPIEYVPVQSNEERLDCGSATGYAAAQEYLECRNT